MHNERRVDPKQISGSVVRMAWRLNKAVIRGEIDNRIKGVVTGKIWLVGVADPIDLQLEGDCWRDMAGCLLTFENPNPQKADDEHSDLNLHQGGLVGDMTASRKVRVLEIPVEEAYRMCKRGEKPPEHMGNCLYLEWYSDFNGRVVIESTNYQITISEPAWLMTEAEEVEQRETNSEAIVKWMERLTGAISATERKEEIEAAEDREWSPDDDAPMDEFEWEKFMKESDKRTDKMMELYEKYDGVEAEERERLIAREMGWEPIEEYLKAKEAGEIPEKDWDIPDLDEVPDPQPNPLTEGIDWVRNERGHPVHPLYNQMFEIVTGMWHDCEDLGLIGENGDQAVRDMVFASQRVNAKLAGALNSIWMDHDRDGGCIVACLKRSLKYFNETMGHFQTVQKMNKVPVKRLEKFHVDLCSIREEILLLMDQYRNSSF